MKISGGSSYQTEGRLYNGNGVGNQGRKRFSWAGVDMWSENFMLSEKV